jgi:MFS family permease
VGSLLTRTVTGRLTDRIGGRAVAVAGFVLVALATVPLALAGPGTSEWWLGAVLPTRPRPARPPDNRQLAAGDYGLRSSGWHRHLPGSSRR